MNNKMENINKKAIRTALKFLYELYDISFFITRKFEKNVNIKTLITELRKENRF